eukprot:CAMPEP_0119334664 /NCGR_PEP_ID=MMETSP1333-20130426/87777_1 /TAXON_ID=418940 /ORGANISM="Scyphosphaera apsteinii, Strain RCC1455" /LENGTH=67 /DNA_ID=CAMNT_0007345011 /DNA_START=30 /DNA_END=230 /DNA_ORIENTATION=+
MKSYRNLDKYLDFGELTLLVLGNTATRDFFIMDGQHRIATMERLYEKNPAVPLHFHFRVVVCSTEKE